MHKHRKHIMAKFAIDDDSPQYVVTDPYVGYRCLDCTFMLLVFDGNGNGNDRNGQNDSKPKFDGLPFRLIPHPRSDRDCSPFGL